MNCKDCCYNLPKDGHSYCTYEDGECVKISVLEKENAELKETLKTYNGCGDWDNDFHTCRVYLQHEELQMYIEQLTEAKELLKRWVDDKVYTVSEQKDLIADTEQFLNSEVEK